MVKRYPLIFSFALISGVLSGCGSGSGTSTTAATTGGGATLVGACASPAKNMTFDTSKTGLLYAKGDIVCFDATSTGLSFNGKTLTSPVKNTVVTAPFSAYSFTDGAIKYEVVFNGTAIYEINVSDATGFVGQFS